MKEKTRLTIKHFLAQKVWELAPLIFVIVVFFGSSWIAENVWGWNLNGCHFVLGPYTCNPSEFGALFEKFILVPLSLLFIGIMIISLLAGILLIFLLISEWLMKNWGQASQEAQDELMEKRKNRKRK